MPNLNVNNSSGTVTGSISSYAQYDIAGNIVKAIDGRGNAVTFDFSDRFGAPDGDARANNGATELAGLFTYAFPTKVTNPLGHEAYTQFDYYLSKPVDSEDANNVKSSLYNEDALDRSTRVIQAVGTSVQNQILFRYNDTGSVNAFGDPARSITTVSDKNTYQESSSNNGLKVTILYDGLGRTWRRARYEGNTGSSNTWTIAETQFDAASRAWRACNPFRATVPDAALPSSPEWTTTNFDAISRVTRITSPDSAYVESRYSGNAVTVIDGAKKVRRSFTDALGRLTRVDEPSRDFTASELTQNPLNPDLLLGAVGSPVQSTTYGYHVLGSLTTVTQGSQTRTFSYDSLNRLTSTSNPENGTMSYTYDNNGNMLTKTDARSITTTYAYDVLNRNTSVTHSTLPNGTADVYLYYDTAPNGKGRFTYSVSYNSRWDIDGRPYWHADVIAAYDALGRPTSKWQGYILYNAQGQATTWQQYNLSRTYNLAGAVTSETYPSGRVVNYSYNTAGQLASFTGRLGGLTSGGNDVGYATEMKYNPRGQLTRETFGMTTTLYHRTYYNRRGQMFDTRIGTSSNTAYDVENPAAWRWENGTWNRGALRMYYSTTNNDYDDYTATGPALVNNNGNVWRSEHFVPNAVDGSGNITSWVMGTDSYSYDALNRVTQVVETATGGTGQGFTQKFLYDRWGNRTIDVANTSNVGGGVTRDSFTVDPTNNNRLNQKNGITLTYDAVGNQMYDGVGNRYFDAENKIGKAVQGGVTSYYYYNAGGQRVRRVIGGAETWQVYGFDGQMVAEYNVGGAFSGSNPPAAASPAKEYGYRDGQMLVVFDSAEPAADDKLRWLVTDQHGSTRMLVNRSGSLGGVRRRDYLPFGEELVGLGHRAAGGSGYPAPGSPRQQFAGYERDGETGLDYAGARYHASTQGRFTGCDPAMGSMALTDPQSLNRYIYAMNNPLRYVDPDGRIPIETALDVVSLGHSLYKLYHEPSWVNAAFFIWDAVALTPYVPGSWSAKALRAAHTAGAVLPRGTTLWAARVGSMGYRGIKATGIIDKKGNPTTLANALEIAANNYLIRKGYALLSQGDAATRILLKIVGTKMADFIGVNESGRFIVAESKRTETSTAMIQLTNGVQGLAGLLRVEGIEPRRMDIQAELIMEHGDSLGPNYKVQGDYLYQYINGAWEPVTIEYYAGDGINRVTRVQVTFLR